MLALFLGILLIAFYLLVGVSFWRLHKDDLMRLAAYYLLRTEELAVNFSIKHEKTLQASTQFCRRVLSWGGVGISVLTWPLAFRHYRRALDLAQHTARLIGDDAVCALTSRIKAIGFAQADEHIQKSLTYYRDGFMVRRLDADLVAIIWHARAMDIAGIERKYRALEKTLIRWGHYPEIVAGEARDGQGNALPYLVIYEPFRFGAPLAATGFWSLWKGDLRRLKQKFLEDSTDSTEEIAGGPSTASLSREKQISLAYARFVRASLQSSSEAFYTAPQN